jgi:uncharacterized ion transporter superfamily protein YfcC
MRAIIEDENADDGVKLRVSAGMCDAVSFTLCITVCLYSLQCSHLQSYCQKHSVTSKKEKSGSASEDEESKRKKRKDMTSEEKNQARAAKYVAILIYWLSD